MMRHYSNARSKLVKDVLWVEIVEHSFFDLAVKIDRDFLKVFILNEPGVSSLFLCLWVQEFPLWKPNLVLETGNARRDKSDLPTELFERCRNNRLVFNRVQWASAVCNLAAYLQKLNAFSEDCYLQRVKALRISRVPVWPLLRYLSYSSIWTARNVTANPIVLNSKVISLVCLFIEQVWE